MKERIRFIGGPDAGREMMWDRERCGPTIKIPERPDFPPGSLPGDEAIANGMRVHCYRIHEIRFDSGHRHLYAFHDGCPVVSAFNEMWHRYAKAVNFALDA